MTEPTDKSKSPADSSPDESNKEAIEEAGDDQTQAFNSLDPSETFGLDSFAPLQSNPGANVGKSDAGHSTSPPEDEPQQTLRDLPNVPEDGATLVDPTEVIKQREADSRRDDASGSSPSESPTLPVDVTLGEFVSDDGDLPTIVDAAQPDDGKPSSIDELIQLGVLTVPSEMHLKQGVFAMLDGRYAVLSHLGEGGMGVVYLARDNQSAGYVAIKMIRPRFFHEADARKRFIDEAEQMQKMPANSCVLGVKAIGTEDKPYYVMEYMSGGSLGRLLKKEKSLNRDRVIDLAINMATAIHQVHTKTGRIHRDIKPENVLLTEQGEARLCDFGLIYAVGEGESGLRAGTLAYMPPEIVTKDNKNIGFEWDVYSFGALLYEMLSGERPYNDVLSAKTDLMTRMRTLREAMVKRSPDSIRKLNRKADSDLVEVAEGAMAREVRDRYVSMADVLNDLERIKIGKQPLGPRQRRGVGMAITLVALLALFVSGALVWPKLFPSAPVEVERIVGKAGVKVDPPLGLETTEAGGQATFTVVLDSKPKAPVTIPILSDMQDEGIADVTELVFTPDAWNKPQTVTITGQQDEYADGPVSYVIYVGPAVSEDSQYNDFKIPIVKATNMDDDEAGIDVSITPGQSTSESGTKVRFQVGLRSKPIAQVVLPISVSDDTEAAVEPMSVTFTPDDWNEPRTISVIGKPDNAQDGSVRYSVNLGPGESVERAYNGMRPEPIQFLNLDTTSRHVTTKTGNGILDGINAKQAFDVLLTIDGDENKRTFKAGAPIKFAIHVDQPAHVTLFMVSLDNPDVATLVFPNVNEKVKLVKADEQLITPTDGIIVSPPTGKVLIKAIATDVPLPVAAVDASEIKSGMYRFGVKALQTEDPNSFDVIQDLNKILAADKWATAELIIEIAASKSE